MKITLNLLTPALLLSGIFASPLMQAAPITGVANIEGNVSVQLGLVGFNPVFTTTSGATETGAFAGLTGGAIQSLTGPSVTGMLASPIVSFINFTTGLATPVSFDVNFIAPGVGTAAGCTSSALGSACTPTGSPFTLFQLSSNTILASLQMNGFSYTGSSATGSSATTAIFSTQTVGTVPQIYNTLISGGVVSGITYSASLVATAPSPTIPEPYSIGLVAIGLIAAGLVARRKKAV